MEELVARVFAARDVAHREHLRTRSFAQHMALGEFYPAIIEAVDAIVECYQGQYGLLGDYQVQTSPVLDVMAWLAAEMAWIEDNRSALARGNTAIENLIDALTEHYQRVLYKLTYLA